MKIILSEAQSITFLSFFVNDAKKVIQERKAADKDNNEKIETTD